MYEELIKRLREYATEDQWVQTRIGDTFVEAADAIEELNRENKEIMFRANQLEAMNDSLIKDDEEQAKDVGYWAGRRDYEPKWIPVTERLPDNDCNCIVFSDGYVKEAHFYYGKFYDPIEDYMRYKATHWMPLPSPPVEE